MSKQRICTTILEELTSDHQAQLVDQTLSEQACPPANALSTNTSFMQEVKAIAWT